MIPKSGNRFSDKIMREAKERSARQPRGTIVGSSRLNSVRPCSPAFSCMNACTKASASCRAGNAQERLSRAVRAEHRRHERKSVARRVVDRGLAGCHGGDRRRMSLRCRIVVHRLAPSPSPRAGKSERPGTFRRGPGLSKFVCLLLLRRLVLRRLAALLGILLTRLLVLLARSESGPAGSVGPAAGSCCGSAAVILMLVIGLSFELPKNISGQIIELATKPTNTSGRPVHYWRVSVAVFRSRDHSTIFNDAITGQRACRPADRRHFARWPPMHCAPARKTQPGDAREAHMESAAAYKSLAHDDEWLSGERQRSYKRKRER